MKMYLIISLFLLGICIEISAQTVWSKIIMSPTTDYTPFDAINWNNDQFLIIARKNKDGIIFKIDDSGNILNEIIINDVYLLSMSIYKNEGVVIFGQSFDPYSESRIFMLDTNLVLQWDSTYNEGSSCYFRDGAVLPNGDIIAGGVVNIGSSVHSNLNYWLLLTDKKGKKISSFNFGNERNDRFEALTLSDNGTVILVGSGYNEDINSFYALKVGLNGTKVWEKRFNFSGRATDIIKTVNSNSIIVGNNGSDIYSLEISEKGDSLSSFTYPEGTAESITNYKSQGFIISGYSDLNFSASEYDAVFIVVDHLGNIIHEYKFDYPRWDIGIKAIMTDDNGILFLGNTKSFWPLENDKIFLIKSDSTGNYDELTRVKSKVASNKFYISQNYPNPFNPVTVINYSLPSNLTGETNDDEIFVNLTIFDILGREVATVVEQYQRAGNYTVEFDANHISGGVYLYRIQVGDFIQFKKMVYLK